MDITTRLAQWAENDMRAEGVALDAKYEIERLRKALERIAQYDIQAWAIDAIAPNTRVQQKDSE